MDINSTPYWDSRFATDWEERNGPAQTAFFAFVAASMLPEWLKADINARALSVNDLGCAEGSALPYLARIFDRSRLTGSDVSAVAIEMARERHPEFGFSVIGVDPTPKTDVVFCSNTIEHFEDWQAKLNEFALTAGEHIIVIAPFQEPEEGRFAEHFASFDFDVFPPEVGDGLSLSYFATLTTAYLPNSYWIGKQFMAVWSRKATSIGSAAAEAGSTVYSVDLRGLTPDQIRLAMKLSAESYSKLDAAWEAERSARAELHAKVEEQKWKSTERENEFLTQKVALENEIYATRVMAQNQLHTMRVTCNNKLYAAGLTPDAEDLLPVTIDWVPDTAGPAPDMAASAPDVAGSPPGAAAPVLDAADRVLDQAGLVPDTADDAIAPDDEQGPETAQRLKQALADARNYGEKYRKTAADLVYAIEAYSSRIAVTERTLQARNEALSQNYRRILGMRSFRYMMKGLSAYGRLRGRTIALPSAPERSTIAIERPDVRAWLKQSGDLIAAPPPVAIAQTGSPSNTRDMTPTRIVVIASDSARASAHAAAIVHANAVLGQKTIVAAPKDRADGIAAVVGCAVYGLDAPAEAAVAELLSTANVLGLIAIGTDIGIASSEDAGIPAFRVHDEGEPASTSPISPSGRHFALSDTVASSLVERMPTDADALLVLKPALDVFRLIRPEKPLLHRLRHSTQPKTTVLLLGDTDNNAASDALATAVAKLRADFPNLTVAHPVSAPSESVLLAPREASRALAEAHVAVALSEHLPEERLLEAGYFQLPIIAADTRFAQEACGAHRGIVLPFAPLASDAIVSADIVDALVSALRTVISDYESWARNAGDSDAWALQYSGEYVTDLYNNVSDKGS